LFTFFVSLKREKSQRVNISLSLFQVVCHFENIFGPELKSITDDPAIIDAAVKRVEKLVSSISQADFDIFDKKYELNWQELVGSFYHQVSKLEIEAKYFIDECFKLLR
jgi:archaellum component FlaC